MIALTVNPPPAEESACQQEHSIQDSERYINLYLNDSSRKQEGQPYHAAAYYFIAEMRVPFIEAAQAELGIPQADGPRHLQA
jgi:hypothetical protein